ncbi:hypothetical protein FRB99_007460 [Tulasnella sp. 403]|nr:hypothetical protein FRB99_007460 [Tulasnella sp. 403]
MKSIATFLSSSKKKDKDRDKDSKLRAGDFLAPDPRPTNIFRRTPSPAPSSSTSSLRKHTFGFGTNTESRRQQHQEQPQRPALSRSFFRSVVDVSRIAHASSGNNGHHSSERGSPVVDSPAPSELGTLAPERPPRTDATYPGSMRPSDTIMDDVYDPFAAHYQPPPRLEKPRVPSPPSPPRLLPRLAEVPQGQRPRALSLGSAARPPCPAHVLGPLPPLPQLPPSLKVPQPSTTNGLEGDASPPKSAPPQVVSFPTSRARSGSTSKTSLVGVSSDKTITRGPSRLSAKTISPTDSVGSSLTDSSSAPVIGSRSGSGDSPGRSSVSQSRRLTKAPVPQLEQTWQRFLHEVEEDSQTLVPPSNFSKSTIQLVPSTSSRASIVSRSKAASKPRAPPPSRPLPSLPPAAPLNIRRRERAQTMVTSNSKGSPPSRLILPKTSKSGDLQQMSPFTPPISPPASAGPRQFFDNLLDVIVTPAHAQDGPSAKQRKSGYDSCQIGVTLLRLLPGSIRVVAIIVPGPSAAALESSISRREVWGEPTSPVHYDRSDDHAITPNSSHHPTQPGFSTLCGVICLP